ncbi:hypothetical protein EKL32_21545 [Flavobacterium sp. GSN2]|nr:hypothetical protein EKL32_21545 [Flavobacterium sp. GSN2]
MFVFLLLATAAASCDSVGDDKELNYGNGAYVAQFPFAESTGYFLKDDAVIYDYNVPVQLVGGNGLALTNDVVVSFEQVTYVPGVGDNKVSAVEGVDFEFVNTANSFTIPAGSAFASLPIRVLSGNLNDQAPSVLVLKLTEVDGSGTPVVASGNKGTISLILQGTCTSDLAGNYKNVTTRLSTGAQYKFDLDVFDELDLGIYNTSYVGPYYGLGQTAGSSGNTVLLGGTADAGYTFKEVCGRVKVETQNLGGAYSNEVRQSAAQYAASSVNPDTGVITIEYSIWFTGNTVERKFRSIYTKLIP